MEKAHHYWNRRRPNRYLTRANADEVGRMLWQANFDNTDALRDPADVGAGFGLAELPDYVFEEVPGDPDPLVVLRAVDCYVYQTAGEPDVWYPGEPAAFTDWLSRAASARLPGYSDGPWYVEDRSVFLTAKQQACSDGQG